MQNRLAVLSCACAVLWLQPAAAQSHAGADPADPRAAVPPPQHASAFTGYRPFSETRPADWRTLNDEVARAGGHVGILRDAATGTPPSASAPGRHRNHHPGGSQ